MFKCLHHALIALIGVTVVASAATASVANTRTTEVEPPEVFSRLAFTEAKARAEVEGKLFMAHATAEWCGPCKRMDATTYVDESVTAWMNEHMIAVQVDVDEHPDLAGQLGIRAMPTMVVFREGKAFDRVTGYRGPDAMLEWFENVRAGRSESQQLLEPIEPDADGRFDIDRRLRRARALVTHNRLDDATDEFIWLWENMLDHDPAFAGVRGSFMASDMADLARRHPAALERFTQLRDQTWEMLNDHRHRHPRLLSDWIVFNEIIDDNGATLEWFDRIKDDPAAQPTLQLVAYRLEQLLIARDRWHDLLALHPDPIKTMREEIQQRERMRVVAGRAGGDMQDEMLAHYQRMSVAKCAMLYAATLAADQEDVAASLIEYTLEKMPDQESMLRRAAVRSVLEAGVARPEHVEWIESIEPQTREDTALLDTLRAALQQTA